MTLSAEDAHEINNLLVYVILGLELVEREAGGACDKEKIRGLVKDALEGAEKVRALVKELRAPPPPKPLATNARRVLLIDDDPRLAVALRAGLTGIDLVAARTGAEALQQLSTGAFDLVLCDLALPDISGIDVFEKAPAELRDKFVFMSGGAQDDRAREFLASHPRLDKPFRLEEVEGLLSSAK